MSANLYISRRVTDLTRTRAFWQALGYADFPEVPAEYRDKTLPMTLADGVMVCFLTDDLFTCLNATPMAAPGKNPECIITIPVESRAKADAMLAKAVAAGGRDTGEGMDLGFVYTASFTDPDGHWWEFQWDGAPPEDAASTTEAC